jgi:hypothetical protein
MYIHIYAQLTVLYNHVSLHIQDVKDNVELAKPTIVRSCLLRGDLCELHSVMKTCIHILCITP